MCLGALLNLNTSVAARKQNEKHNSTRWDVGKITLSYTTTEQISIKCWEYSGFLLLLLQCALIVLENSHHLSQPIRCKDKTNHSLVFHVFPRFRYCFPSKNDFSLAACNFFLMFLLADVPTLFWSYDTGSKNALSEPREYKAKICTLPPLSWAKVISTLLKEKKIRKKSTTNLPKHKFLWYNPVVSQ